jgi:hypothetical protein
MTVLSVLKSIAAWIAARFTAAEEAVLDSVVQPALQALGLAAPPQVTIIRKALDCTGKGTEVWVAEDDAPIFLMGVMPEKVDPKLVENIILARFIERAEAENRAAIDGAITAEMERRKASVVNVYEKTPEEAIAVVFPTVTGGTK